MNTSQENGSPVAINWRKVISRITILIGIGMLVSVAIPALISKPIQLRTLLQYNPVFLLLALIIGLLPLFLHAWTLTIWGHYFKKDISTRDGVNIASTALLGSAVTPTMLGGAPLKMALLVLHGFRAGQAAAVASLGSLQDLLAFIAIIAISIFISDDVGADILINRLQTASLSPKTIWLIILAIAVVGGALYIIMKQTAWGDRIRAVVKKSIGDFVSSYKLISQNGKGIFLATSMITLVRWLCTYFVLILLLMALNLEGIDYVEAWSQQWIVFTGMTVTPLPGGAGGAEAVFYFVYSKMLPEEILVGLILLWRFFSAYLRIIFAALLVILVPMRSEVMSNQ